MQRIVALLMAVATSSLAAQAADVTLDWNVGYVQNVNPDGKFERRAISVNGQFPTPIININQDDFLKIDFKNTLGDGTPSALHSHGMFFNSTAYWDGAAMITQCPIPDGQSISYEPHNSPNSPADRMQQWGTYWTHGHYNGQYADGLRAPSIIHANVEPHAYDDDYTVILADWYHEEYTKLVTSEFLNVKNPTGAEPVPDSGLIYIAHTPQNGTASYLPGFNENVTLPFEAGKTYRLRIINMSALSMYHFWLEGHDMRIIEADGVDMQELPVDLVSISVAQRYSVLVTARNDTSENWIIHANQDPVMFDVVPPEVQLNLTSTISYAEGNPIGSGVATIGAVDDEGMYPYFDDTTLVPIVVMPMVEADVSHTLAFNFDTYSDGKNYAAFNSKSFVAPQVPTLLTAQTMPLNYTTDAATYGPNTNVVVMNHLDMVEIVLANLDAGSHPMHIHGTQFQIVHKSRDDASMDPAINPPFREGLTNPARRDTITIPAGGSATIRFRADNPGAWLLHCHIAWHLSSGLAAVLVDSPDLIASQLKTPSYIPEQCQMMNMPSSGNAGGLQSATDFGTLAAGPKPLVAGWTPNAIGTVVACIISALIGLATICWYGFSSNGDNVDDDDDDEEEVAKKETPTSTINVL